MRIPKPKLLVFLWPCFLALNLFARENRPDTGLVMHIAAILREQSDKAPAEKVYLHLDKPYYMAGDDIWFKAYVTSGGFHQLSLISGVLNVELVNDAGKQVVQAIKLPVRYGLSTGDFHLPYAFPAGHYHIRAYTHYMRNIGADCFFNQPVRIGNTINATPVGQDRQITQRPKSIQQPQANPTLAASTDVQFFPEGGTLVNGINTKVAFKAVGADGTGKWLSGVITDNDGLVITRFSSVHRGMGSFYLYPATGKAYKALLTFADSSHQTLNLPVAGNSGYVFRVFNLAENGAIAIRVSCNAGAHNPADSVLTLVAQSGGYICYAAKIIIKGGITSGRIPRERFPTGIAQFTLFTAAGEPLCERVTFINNHDQLNIALTDSNRVNTARHITQINLHIKDTDGKPAIGSFSAAVIDDNIVPDDELSDRDNILTYLLLTSDLKGNIEAPTYYFNNDNDTTRTALDLLMLTQGYRRFDWKQALTNSTPTMVYLPEHGLTVSGRLLTPGDNPVARGRISMFNKASNFLADTLTDDQGAFAFHNLLFTDSLRFLLTAKTAAGGNEVHLIMDEAATGPVVVARPRAPGMNNADYISMKFDTASIPGAYRQYSKHRLASNKDAILLNEIKIKAAAPNKRTVSAYSSNLNGPGNADQILTSKDLESQGGDLATILMGRIIGVRVINGRLISNRSGSLSGGANSRSMLIILDGNYLNGDLSSINPVDVESIEVLKSGANTAIYGSRGANGVVVITSKHGESRAYESPPNTANITLQGFYKAREFYTPKYDDQKVNAALADIRSTIHWKPAIITDKDGNASFSYFNAGSKSTYRVIVEGIDLNGKVGYQVYHYKVE